MRMNKVECRDLFGYNLLKNGELNCDNHAEPIRIVRQYVNPAVYVESSIYDMAPFRRSPLLLNYFSDNDSLHRVVKIKRCVCLTDPDNCACHPFDKGNDSKVSLASNKRICASASVSDRSLKSFDTGSTIKVQQDDLKISLPSLLTGCTSSQLDYPQNEEAFRNWCLKKDKQRKKAEEERLKQEEMKQKERERLLQIERENFKQWLTRKKLEEEKRKLEKEKEVEALKLQEMERERKKIENEIKYRLWLKQKEEIDLEKKIKEHFEIAKTEEEKQKRMELSMKAYEEWLKSSKYKPKPVPSNQGLQSLKTSVSVTYINPTPWIPNI